MHAGSGRHTQEIRLSVKLCALQIAPGAVFGVQQLAVPSAEQAALSPGPSVGPLSEDFYAPLLAPSPAQPEGRRKLQASVPCYCILGSNAVG